MAALASTSSMCVKRYFTEPKLYTLTTTVRSIGSDDKGRFARLAETIFHPQGGGQPFDLGKIGPLNVVRVEKEGTPTEFDIKHYVEGEFPLIEGQEVECSIDVERRKTNARLHSAGHLIAAIAEKHLAGLKAVKGHHIPGECSVAFEKGTHTADEVRALLTDALPKAIDSNLPVSIIFTPEGMRTIQVGDFEAVGCGGTHVSSLGEIGPLTLKSVNVKSGQIRVSYA